MEESTTHETRKDGPKQEKIRSSLTKELETVVKAAIASPYSSKENIPSEITQNLCNSIEAIFIHGLKDPFFLKGTRYAKYPEPNFWPFVSKYSHKSVTNQIMCLKQVKSEIGKSRAWIRIVLNENSLSHYLDLLASEKGSIQQFYGEEAFLRYLGDNEYSEQIRGILKPLSKLPIYAATNSSFLNTWTPTPLILAGLMDGNPLRVGALAPRRNPRLGSESEETAVSALDMLVPEEDHDIGSPNRLTRRRVFSKTAQQSDEDDRSSCYSHPSMLDAGEMTYQAAVPSRRLPGAVPSVKKSSSTQRLQLPQSPLFTSTPVEKTILDIVEVKKKLSTGPVAVVSMQDSEAQQPQSFAPLIVSRRTKRPSKHSNSRSSSESTSKEGGYARTEVSQSQSVRAARADSDMPSTIFGTVPNEAAFSMDEGQVQQVQLVEKVEKVEKPATDTIDSGICDLSEQIEEKTSGSLLDALTQLADAGSSESRTEEDSEMNLKNSDEERRDKIGEDDVFEVEMDEPKHSEELLKSIENVINEPTLLLKSPEAEESSSETQPIDIEIETNRSIQILQKTDSILGTSLRDELLEIEDNNETFEQGIPIYVQSPAVMGNSLAAIGARNQLAWETNSERSRLSSSSESCGPVVSFGQALRSAMHRDGSNEYEDSICCSPRENTDHDDSLLASSSTSELRKPSLIVEETTEKLCRIAREKGLDAQDFRCAMCRKSIGGSTYGKFETCAIDGMYYCSDCMKNGGKSPIPARILMDWDWRERPISDRGRSWIDANLEKAYINIEERNSKLYTHVPQLLDAKNIREKLQLASMYLFNCRESVAEDFRRRVWPKEYFHSDIHKYSYSDLIDVKSGSLQRKLTHLLKHSVTHIMGCNLCKQKGFICELCSINEVIYPFMTEDTRRCPDCFSVFHKHCWKASTGECPKCIRKQQFEARRALIDDPHSVLCLQP